MINVYEIREECKSYQTPGHFDRTKCHDCPYYVKVGGLDDCKAAQALAFAVPLNWQLQNLEGKNENL